VIRRPRKVTGQNHSEHEVMERLRSFRSSLADQTPTSPKTEATPADSDASTKLKYPELGAEASAFIEARDAELSRDESGWKSHSLHFKTIQVGVCVRFLLLLSFFF
jgi:hypothetical protein